MGKRGNNEGSIYKRADGRWVAAVTLPDGKRKSLYGKTRAEVAKKLATAMKTAQEGIPLPPERETVGAYLERWLTDVAKPSVRPNTFVSYQVLVKRHLIPALGKIPLSRLSPQDVQAVMNRKRAEKLSPRYVQYMRSILRSALNQAVRWGLVVRNVAALVTPPKMERYEIRPWTPDQARSFLAFIKGDPLEALFTLALATGARRGELLALRWDDIDLEEGLLQVRGTLQRIDGKWQVCEPKTERARRTIALSEPTVNALRAHRVCQLEERLRTGDLWQDFGHVFTAPLGTPLSPNTVSHRFHALVKRSGLPDQRFHDLRHCAASYMLVLGESPRVVMDILGHSQISMTLNTYSHVIPSLQRAAANRLGALLAADA